MLWAAAMIVSRPSDGITGLRENGEDLQKGKKFIKFEDFVSTTKVLHISDLDVICE